MRVMTSLAQVKGRFVSKKADKEEALRVQRLWLRSVTVDEVAQMEKEPRGRAQRLVVAAVCAARGAGDARGGEALIHGRHLAQRWALFIDSTQRRMEPLSLHTLAHSSYSYIPGPALCSCPLSPPPSPSPLLFLFQTMSHCMMVRS